MTWNIAPECTSLLFLLALIVYSRSRLTQSNFRDGVFRTAAWVTLAAITMNIASTMMIYATSTTPTWATFIVTSFYFVLTPVMPLIYFYYVVIFLQQVESLSALDRRWYYFSIPYLIYLVILFLNIWTNLVFTIDPVAGYVQGPLLYGTYIVLYFYSFSVSLLALQSRKRIGQHLSIVIAAFPLIALGFIMVQKFFKDVILTGTASVFSLMILFLYIQNNRLSRDGLTGLFNRKALLETVRRRVKQGERFELLAVSLDNFKSVNLRFGSRIGDEILRSVGEFLATLGDTAVVYRYSGDIFALLTAPGNAELCIRAVNTRFGEPFLRADTKCRLSASMALVRHPESNPEEDPVSALDYAVTEAKRRGGGKLTRYEHEMIAQKKRRQQIVDALNAAIENDGFYLCFQPVWSISEQRFVSAEALLRMRETPIGPVYPNEFIPIANDSGLIVPITYLVLEKACAMCAQLGDQLSSMSVNFPYIQFMEPDLEARVTGTLERAGVAPERIKIEITERVLIEENPMVNEYLRRMSERGIRFCLDDFGIGYSNVEVMLRVPMDVIKLDRSLVLAGMRTPSHADFLARLVAGFTAMGRAVVAEGVETDEQLAFVKACGCDLVQGYYFARPMPGDVLPGFLSAEGGAARNAIDGKTVQAL